MLRDRKAYPGAKAPDYFAMEEAKALGYLEAKTETKASTKQRLWCRCGWLR